MQIRITVRMGLVGCVRHTVIEIEDDMTEEEIDEVAREALFQGELISLSWKRIDSGVD